jgi:possible adenosylcobyric acid synthase (glutamine-hydrolyzing)
MTKSLTIMQLYPKDMNIYGDWGNTLTLKRRAERYGYDVEVIDYNPGDTLPSTIDIIVGGGGQDSGQKRIEKDLQAIAPQLHSLAEDGVPMLMVCGLYQLFGHDFTTATGETIPGIGLIDAHTVAGDQRLVGNIVTKSDQFGEIIGYENHSGQTTLGPQATPLGAVIKGSGNNTEDNTEGAITHNVIGTYLHGSLLPKNPAIADFLIQQAALHKYGEFTGDPLDDTLADKARNVARDCEV